MKAVKVCLVVRVMSGGSAEGAEFLLSIRRVWSDDTSRQERARLLSRLNYFESDAGESWIQETHRPHVN